jgi:predicted nucleic acid-binding protein
MTAIVPHAAGPQAAPGVVVGLLVGRLDETALGEEEAGVPHLLDSEVTSVLRRLVLRGDLTVEQGDAAMARFGQSDLERFPADWLRPRMWDLREDLTAYDATYVALTEAVGATALLTTDARLAGAPGLRCTVRVV